MANQQPSYTKEFKQEAVRLVETSNKTKAEIARDLGISDSALSKWCKEFATYGGQAFPGKGHQTELEEKVKQLQRENEILKQERDILKKRYASWRSPSYKICVHSSSSKRISCYSSVPGIGSLESSGYYAWRKREPSQRKRDDERLGKLIEDAYQNHRQVYGSPRVHAELKEQAVHCGRKPIARLMRERGIRAKARRRKVKTTDSQHDNPVAPNLLKRDFTADAPNTKWVADITGIGTAEGWLYLAAIVDIYSRLVVGWAMSKERDEQLITKAAKMAITQRRPGAGLVHHSARGSQYSSQDYMALLQQYDIQVSRSGKGDCYDNALMESFFGTLKEECVERQTYQTRAEARNAVFEYMEVFYNRQRKHSSVGYVSPVTYEQMRGGAEL